MARDESGHFGNCSNAAVRAIFDLHNVSCPDGLGAEIYGSICSDLSRDNKSLADDLFQEVLANAWRGIGKKRPEHPRGWLHQIRRNTTITFLRQEARKKYFSLIESFDGDGLQPLVDFSDDVALELLERALQRIRPRYAQFIDLDLNQRLSPDQIKAEMNIRSDGYFRKLKSQAFKALREALKVVAATWIGSAMS